MVINSKQHLAVLIPCGPGLVLNLLRWGDEIRSWDALKLPPRDTKVAGVKPAEMAMAKQLIEEMDATWDPANFTDSFREAIMDLVEQKAQAGHIETVAKVEGETATGGGEVVDLTALLKRSLERGAKPREPVQLSMVPPAEKPRKAVKAKAASPTPAKRTAAKAMTKQPARAAPATTRGGRKAA